MNIYTFFNENILQAVGLTLIHSLWQITLIGILLKAGLWLLRKYSAEFRFHLLLAGMFTILIVTGFTFYQLYETPTQINEATENYMLNTQLQGLNEAEVMMFQTATSEKSLAQKLQYWIKNNAYIVTFIWSIGFLFFLIRFAGGYFYIARLQKKADPVNQQILDLSIMIKQKLEIRKSIKVLESAMVKIPIAMGYLKPAIILPLGLATSIPFNQLEAIITHEMAHIKRHDFLVNLLKSFFEAIFFYHPVFWWISKEIENERENCCDDLTIAVSENNWVLPQALLNIELQNQKLQHIAPALYKNKFQLLKRIKRMKTKNNLNPAHHRPINGMIIIPVIVILFGLITAFAPNTKDLPNFNFHNDPAIPMQMGINAMHPVQPDQVTENSTSQITPISASTPNEVLAPDTNKIKYGSKIKTEDGYVLMEFDEEMNLQKISKNGKELDSEEREKYEKIAAKSKKAFDTEKETQEREKMMEELEEQLKEVKIKMAEVQAEYNQVLNSYIQNMASTDEDSWAMVHPEYLNAEIAEVWQGMEDFHFNFEDFPAPEIPEVYFDEEEWKAHEEEAKRRYEEAFMDFNYQYEQQRQVGEMQERARAHERDARAMETETREMERQARKIEVGIKKELLNDGLIENWSDLQSFELSKQKFEVNGDQQSKKMHKKYLELYEELSSEKLNGRFQLNTD